MGDILSDLPPVGNFTFAERAQYVCSPKTPTQMWLQRDPPDWQASRESRADRAEGFMQEGHAALEEKIRKGEDSLGGVEKVGVPLQNTTIILPLDLKNLAITDLPLVWAFGSDCFKIKVSLWL